MASAVTTQKALSAAYRVFYDFDPDATGPTDVGWVDMRDYSYFLTAFVRTIGTGTLQAFAILANTLADGSGTDATVKSHAIGSAPDAIADTIWLECLASELPILLAGARGVSASADFDTATDEAIIYYELGAPRFSYLNLTADVIA